MTSSSLANPAASASQMGMKEAASVAALRNKIEANALKNCNDARRAAFSRVSSSTFLSRTVANASRATWSTSVPILATPKTHKPPTNTAMEIMAVATIKNVSTPGFRCPCS